MSLSKAEAKEQCLYRLGLVECCGDCPAFLNWCSRPEITESREPEELIEDNSSVKGDWPWHNLKGGRL